MRELFDKLIAEGEAGIDRLVAERTQESVTLDFKGKADPRHGQMKDDDRRYYAKALSAFANSAGGLLIFGVDARKGPDDIDCAQEAKPISNIDRFKSEAITESGRLLQPRHDGIVVEAIKSKRQDGSGYLLVRVDRSERRPHRSEASGHRQYFKRAGDNSFEMEHYDIEDAFNRSVVPDLGLSWRLEHAMTFGDGRQVWRMKVLLVNESSMSAKFPYLHVSNTYRFTPQPMMQPGFQISNDGVWTSYNGGADVVIHPGSTHTVVLLPNDISIAYGSAIMSDNGTFGQFTAFDYRFGCLDARPKIGRFEIEIGQLSLMAADICR